MRHPLIASLAVAILVTAATVHATVVMPADLKKLTTTAEAIVHGRVVEVRSQWAPTGRRVETIVTLQVTNYLKGNLGAQLVFRVAGGQIGPYRSVRVGAPVFRPGDEVVIFLAANGPAIPHIVGFNQGVFRVVLDQLSGRRLVSSPALATGNVRATKPIVRGDPNRKPVALEVFEQQVRSLIEQARTDRQAKPRGAGSARPR